MSSTAWEPATRSCLSGAGVELSNVSAHSQPGSGLARTDSDWSGLRSADSDLRTRTCHGHHRGRAARQRWRACIKHHAHADRQGEASYSGRGTGREIWQLADTNRCRLATDDETSVDVSIRRVPFSVKVFRLQVNATSSRRCCVDEVRFPSQRECALGKYSFMSRPILKRETTSATRSAWRFGWRSVRARAPRPWPFRTPRR